MNRELIVASKGKNTHTAACDLIRGNKAVDLFPRIKSQAASRSAPRRCMCVFTVTLLLFFRYVSLLEQYFTLLYLLLSRYVVTIFSFTLREGKIQ
jgi:hypothetical protein